MQHDILINWSPQETRVAIVENGAVQELHVERALGRGLVGNVYLGKVARVLPGMQSAFVDIGLERAAFLHVADVWHRQPDGEPPGAVRSAHPLYSFVAVGAGAERAMAAQSLADPLGPDSNTAGKVRPVQCLPCRRKAVHSRLPDFRKWPAESPPARTCRHMVLVR